ncbi:hypothetical protein TruAng_008277 [Truncatella angustata]|nr:hypothetical protein TruAng_008277 [Truncatella angustata]
MDPSIIEVALIGAGLGITSHLGYFIRGEFVESAPRLLIVALATPPASVALLTAYTHLSLAGAIKITTIGYGAYSAALVTSMVMYRLFFHPLRHFHGPKFATITQMYHAYQISQGNNYVYLARMHAAYGGFVRIGPNTLSVAEPDWVDLVHNRHTLFKKADWYDLGKPRISLQQIRDPVLHDKRRRHGWDKAFTATSLRAYDSRIVKYADILVLQLRKTGLRTVNVTEWFNSFAFDVMGELTFGRAFKALETGKSHPVIDAIHVANTNGSNLHSLPWLYYLEVAMADLECYSVKERQTYEPDEPDIMSRILGAGQFFPNKKEEEDILKSDSRLLIVAGSDTTATALTFAYYHLARDSSIVEKLRKELSQHHITDQKQCNVQQLQDLPYMNAVINEVLRLHPPVPSGFFRETPAEGVNIGGHFLPGGVKLLTPPYVIQRSPKAFVKPNDFLPERWTTRPELILKKEAFFPFLIGRFSCIGKQLALNELRLVLAKLILEFDITFAENEDGRALLEESIDGNTMVLAKLNIHFHSRK